MGTLDRLIDGVKEVLRMSDELKRVAGAVKELSIEVRDLDRRLVRIETIADIAQAAQAMQKTKRLPKPD